MNLLRDNFRKYRKVQKKETIVDNLEQKVIAIATAEHAEAMKEWRRLEAGREQVAQWKLSLKQDFHEAVSSLKSQGLDPNLLIQRPELMPSYIKAIGTAAAAMPEPAKPSTPAEPAEGSDSKQSWVPTQPSKPRSSRAPPPRFAFARSAATRHMSATMAPDIADALIQRTVKAARETTLGDRMQAKMERQAALDTLPSPKVDAAATPAPPPTVPMLYVHQKTPLQVAAEKRQAEKRAASRRAALRVAQQVKAAEKAEKEAREEAKAARYARKLAAEQLAAEQSAAADAALEAQMATRKAEMGPVRFVESSPPPPPPPSPPDMGECAAEDGTLTWDGLENREDMLAASAAVPHTVRADIGYVADGTIRVSLLESGLESASHPHAELAIEKAIAAATAPPTEAAPLIAAFLEDAVEAAVAIAPSAALSVARAAKERGQQEAASLVAEAMQNAIAAASAPPEEAMELMATFLETALSAAAAMDPKAVIAVATRTPPSRQAVATDAAEAVAAVAAVEEVAGALRASMRVGPNAAAVSPSEVSPPPSPPPLVVGAVRASLGIAPDGTVRVSLPGDSATSPSEASLPPSLAQDETADEAAAAALASRAMQSAIASTASIQASIGIAADGGWRVSLARAI